MIEKLKKIINNSSEIIVCGHKNPEVDCIASTVAMGIALERLGKNVHIINEDELPLSTMFLPLSEKFLKEVPTKAKPDLAVIVDCGELARVGNLVKFIKDKNLPIINIDHHVTNTLFGDVNIVDNKASSTGEVIYDIFEKYPIKIDKNIALAIYSALIGDTGSFHYSNTTPKALRCAAKMLEYGISPWFVAENLYENQTRGRIELIKFVLETLYISEDSGYASVEISKDMLDKTKTKLADVDGLINYPRSIKGVEVAVQFREIDKTKFKVSFRSKGKVDVAKIAQAFGGGGHKNAAGCELEGNLENVKKEIFERIEKELK